MTISDESRKELKKLALSKKLRADMATLKGMQHNPFIQDGLIQPKVFIEFVIEYNAFINHHHKAFKPMTGSHFKL